MIAIRTLFSPKYSTQVSGDVYAYAERVICLKTYTVYTCLAILKSVMQGQSSSTVMNHASRLCRRGGDHGLINYEDTKANCRHLKKLTCKGTSRQVFIRV
jgi:hypothetical protein